MNHLFSTYELKTARLKNRIAIPPMCQYMAVDGFANEWHKVHYAALARGGSGLVIVEATGVSPEGRITPNCLGIWDNSHIDGLREIVKSIKSAGAVPGIQLAHAGRKASAHVPWAGDDHISENDSRAWQTIAPSAVAFGGNLPRIPKAMTIADIKRVQEDYVAAAKRAIEAGFEWIELHFAHGYLAQTFFSQHSNRRNDEYGGSFENRSRFSIEIITKIKEVIPAGTPLTARFGVIEYDGQDEKTLSESIELIKKWKSIGIDMISVSVGFTIPNTKIPWGPAFLAPVADRVRKEANIPVSSAWGFGTPKLANEAVEKSQLDLVMIGRAHLENPNWTYQAAKQLKIERPDWVLPAPYAYWLEKYHRPSDEE